MTRAAERALGVCGGWHCPYCNDGEPDGFSTRDEMTEHMRSDHGVDGPL